MKFLKQCNYTGFQDQCTKYLAKQTNLLSLSSIRNKAAFHNHSHMRTHSTLFLVQCDTDTPTSNNVSTAQIMTCTENTRSSFY